MGATFGQWLGRPSTLHFLRQLIAVEDSHARSLCPRLRVPHRHRSCQQSRVFAASAISQDESETGRQDEGASKGKETLNWSYRVRGGQPKSLLNSATLGLHMSLNAGVPLLDKDISMNQSFAELRFQADVNSDQKLGKLLVDEPANVGNAKLWVEILHFRQRLDGLEGVVEVWQGLRRRDVDLPVSGEDAEMLWTTFLHAAVPTSGVGSAESRNLLMDVFDYAVNLKDRTGLHFDGLHKCIVGSLLRSRSPNSARRVLAWSKRLFNAGFRSPDAIASIVVDAILSPHRHRALYSLSAIYLTSGHRNLYDSCVGEAVKVDDDAAALFLHQLFIKEGDGPSNEMFSTPAVQRLFALDKDESLPMKRSLRDRAKHLKPCELDALKAKLPPITRASMNTIVGDVHGIKPKEISDHFCARLFATRAFSVELVIKALSMFGVEKLGTLALREMAIRAGSLVELSNKLSDLKTHGISTGDHVYSQIVLRVVKEGQTSLWNVLLESDQHPESYDDVATQEALLTSFLEQRQWAQAHISLLALSLAGAHSSVRAWNLLLQHYLQHHEYRPMLNTFQNMQSQGLPLLQLSVRDIFWHVLPERQQGKRPMKGRGPIFFDPLDFVTNALIYGSERGANVHHLKWKEILKRYGMDHRWNDVERLVLWLVEHYSIEKSASILGLNSRFYFHRKRAILRTFTLRNIFNSSMRQALLVWGFRSASIRRQLRPVKFQKRNSDKEDLANVNVQYEPWAKGLALLRRLNMKDTRFSIDDARKAFRLRMWILFGPAYSTLGVNNEARRENRLSLAHYIRHANEVWNGLVDWIDPALLKKDQENNKLLLPAFFGVVRRVSSKRREYVDVRAWLQRSAVLKSNNIYEKRLTPSRQAAWERSGLRLLPSPSSKGKHHQRKDKASSGRLLQEHQSPAAHGENSHPPPSLLYTPEQT